eukprot:TRINITY_DN6456_c0_g1_i1.p1 TRINITY_DN6456_c0_g1~~TRINITY_DN6456_c0_g1_i1.p1  ORF type:complete len:57 (-),score=5.85 TRINITY_DN6456_c0_g1_i1:18-188(-)
MCLQNTPLFLQLFPLHKLVNQTEISTVHPLFCLMFCADICVIFVMLSCLHVATQEN